MNFESSLALKMPIFMDLDVFASQIGSVILTNFIHYNHTIAWMLMKLYMFMFFGMQNSNMIFIFSCC